MEGDFIKCSPDRLDLLQSLCPAAAAATILLGRQFGVPQSAARYLDSDSDDGDPAESRAEEEEGGGTREDAKPLVSATTWCSPTLLSRDPQFVLNQTESTEVDGNNQKKKVCAEELRNQLYLFPRVKSHYY